MMRNSKIITGYAVVNKDTSTLKQDIEKYIRKYNLLGRRCPFCFVTLSDKCYIQYINIDDIQQDQYQQLELKVPNFVSGFVQLWAYYNMDGDKLKLTYSEGKPEDKKLIHIYNEGIVSSKTYNDYNIRNLLITLPESKIDLIIDFRNFTLVADFRYMFSGLSIKSIKFKNTQGLEIIALDGMLKHSQIEEVDFGKTEINCTDVSNISEMFAFCMRLKRVDMSNLKFNIVRKAVETFNGCKSLESLKLPKIEFRYADISYMFGQCRSLAAIDFQSCKLGIECAERTFEMCKILEYIELNTLVVNKTELIVGMFADCSKLKHIKFGKAEDSYRYGITAHRAIFKGCKSLEVVENMYLQYKSETILFSITNDEEIAYKIKFIDE